MEDVIKKIYTQMEFDLFDDDDEVDCSDSLPSSSNQEDRVDRGRSHRNGASASPSASALHLLRSGRHDDDDRHDEQLVKAQERRNLERRFSSFTSWVPDLRRVWALKHPGKEPSVHVPRSRSSSKRRAACTDVVLETPMTAGERAGVRRRRRGEGGARDGVKTLFHDDEIEMDVSSSSM